MKPEGMNPPIYCEESSLERFEMVPKAMILFDTDILDIDAIKNHKPYTLIPLKGKFSPDAVWVVPECFSPARIVRAR